MFAGRPHTLESVLVCEGPYTSSLRPHTLVGEDLPKPHTLVASGLNSPFSPRCSACLLKRRRQASSSNASASSPDMLIHMKMSAAGVDFQRRCALQLLINLYLSIFWYVPYPLNLKRQEETVRHDRHSSFGSQAHPERHQATGIVYPFMLSVVFFQL